MKTATISIAISAIVALVIIAGCVQNQTPTPKDCGTDASCMASAEGNCSAAFGRLVTVNMTMYEEIKGETAAGCTLFFNFERPALGNTTCIVPMNLLTQQLDYCQYCTGSFIDLLRSTGGC